jgi:hypothetical protein
MTNDGNPSPVPTSDDNVAPAKSTQSEAHDDTPRPSTTVYSGVYVGDQGNLTVEGNLDVHMTLTTPAPTKDDYWLTFTTAKSTDEQRDALYHLLELINDDDGLAQRLAKLISSSNPQRKRILLRMLKEYHWVRRPPAKLVECLESLVDDDETTIQFVASEVLSKFSHL